jgi:hypothetical protein
MTDDFAAVRLTAAQDLERLRTVARRNPRRCAAHLRQRITGNTAPVDATVDADARILLAEVLFRCGELDPALQASASAAAAVTALNPPDLPRLITALAVETDLAVCAGHEEAVSVCDVLIGAVGASDVPSPRRNFIAYVLRMTAVYHRQDCRIARAELDRLLRVVADDSPYAVVLAEGLDAMRDGCFAPRPASNVGPPPPLPGGVLHPHLDRPAAGFLAYRVRRQQGAHHCASAPPGLTHTRARGNA